MRKWHCTPLMSASMEVYNPLKHESLHAKIAFRRRRSTAVYAELLILLMYIEV